MLIEKLPLGELMTNCYLVAENETSPLVVIDPGDDAAKLRAAIGERKVAGVLITHAHFDHILGLEALRGAPIYVHEADAVSLCSETAAAGYGRVNHVPATDTVHEGDVITLGGLEFTVLHTPGHTPGSVCYQCGDTLFSGDTLFATGWGRTDLPGGDETAMMQSLRRLLRMPVDLHILPGHDVGTTLAALRGER